MKSNLKKILSVIISLLIFINCFVTGAFASDLSPVGSVSEAVAKISITLDKDRVKKDEEITVSIRIDTNYYVAGVQLPVIFDKTKFEIVTGSGVAGFLDFNEESKFLNGSYALNGNTTHTAGFKATSNPEKWNTEEAKAKYSYAWIMAAVDTSASDFRLVVPENEAFVSFKLKALEDVEETTQFVFISSEWTKTEDNKSGVFSLGFSATEANKNPFSYVSTGMTYEIETIIFYVATGIELDCTSATLTKENPTIQLNATVYPDYATDKSVKWKSDDESVAVVDKNGLVTRVGEGGATITATDSAGNTAECDIYIPHQCEKSTMTYYEEIPADCYNSGERAYYECFCGNYFADENATEEIFYSDIYVKPLAHPAEYVVKTDRVEPTHTATGNIEYWTCTLCGDVFSDENCVVEVTDVVIPEKGHEDVSSLQWTQSETHHSKVCSCGEILQSQEHTFEWVTDMEASCDAPGFRYEECVVCKYKRNENTEVTVPHETEKCDAVEPDCTENGNTEYYRCVNCGKYFADEACENEISIEDTVISAKGHSYSDWVTDIPATCEDEGQKHKTCSECGDVVTENIEKISHNITYFEPNESTCTKEGNVGYFYCNSCETYFSDSECTTPILPEETITPIKEHSYSDWITDTPATCEGDGQRHKSCSVCGATVTETLEKTGHNYIPEITPPTTVSEGFTTYTCEYCFDTYKSDFVDMLDEFSFGGTVNSLGDETEEITVVLTSNGGYQVEYKTVIKGNSASYVFDKVAEGEYTLSISKKDHATLTYDIVIDSEGIVAEDTLHRKGDIDGNGKITVADYSRALRHVKKLVILEGYAFSCADVNEDGKINITDYSIMIRHIKKIQTIW